MGEDVDEELQALRALQEDMRQTEQTESELLEELQRRCEELNAEPQLPTGEDQGEANLKIGEDLCEDQEDMDVTNGRELGQPDQTDSELMEELKQMDELDLLEELDAEPQLPTGDSGEDQPADRSEEDLAASMNGSCASADQPANKDSPCPLPYAWIRAFVQCKKDDFVTRSKMPAHVQQHYITAASDYAQYVEKCVDEGRRVSQKTKTDWFADLTRSFREVVQQRRADAARAERDLKLRDADNQFKALMTKHQESFSRYEATLKKEWNALDEDARLTEKPLMWMLDRSECYQRENFFTQHKGSRSAMYKCVHLTNGYRGWPRRTNICKVFKAYKAAYDKKPLDRAAVGVPTYTGSQRYKYRRYTNGDLNAIFNGECLNRCSSVKRLCEIKALLGV